ncbi:MULTISPECIES: thioredoxin [Clostridium]|uniref:Thioredoxin n=1 Tax=Clostridium frigoriphilum TaxID=443253 RepID=A0ABU7UP58_9CLOT|nr:thioredoxin [Clostridium sp. DSM 17811]MBU3097821.1 thioredoxin [Clostridium sp. DSM 17811]
MIKEISDKSFHSEVYSSDRAVVVDFWAPWCGPCKMLGPVMEQLDKEYDGKIKFVKIDVDENPEISSKYSISSIPTIMVFKNKVVEDKLVGFSPKNVLEDKLKKYV